MPVASEWPLLWGSDAPVSLGWTAQCAPRTFPSPLISTFIFNGTLQTVSMADDDAVPDLAAPPSDADTSYGVWNPLLTLALIIASLFLVLLVSVLVIRRVIKMYGATPYTIPYFCVWASKLLPFVKYRNMPIHMSFLPSIRSIENMEVKEDDIFVASFPRSGTTWTQEIVYLVANNANVEKAKATFLSDRFPYLEAPFMGMYKVGKLPAPRLIKTHLHYHLLPAQIHQKNAKIIYVMRNFKDVIVSNYNLFKSFSLPYSGTFSDFCQLFFDDKYIFSPWWRHVKEFWENRHRANILILKYEDMQQDIEGTVRKLSEFLNKPLRDDQIQTIVNHCSFSSMKKNTKVNHKWWDDIRFTQNNDFIRKGKVGDWKNYLSESQSSKADEIVREKLDGTGLSFTDEL